MRFVKFNPKDHVPQNRRAHLETLEQFLQEVETTECDIRELANDTTVSWSAPVEGAILYSRVGPIDLSPWLFCTRKGKGYFNEDSGQATGWDSMWQRFMTRLLKDTEVKERFTEHDLRGKVGSDLASIERATDLLGHASKEITKRHYRRKPEVIKPVR